MSRPANLPKIHLPANLVSIPITGTLNTWEDVTPGGVSLSDTVDGHTGCYGVFGMCGDPTRPAHAYFGSSYRGIYKSTDYGASFAKINTGTGGSTIDGGMPWNLEMTADGLRLFSILSGDGTRGLYMSDDGGVSWAASLLGDLNIVIPNPLDTNHLIVLPHGSTGPSYFESTNKGSSWTDKGSAPFGDGADGSFLSATICIVQSPTGLWQGVRAADGTWTWTNRYDVTGPHGGVQMHRDAVNGKFYVGGQDGVTEEGIILRTTLADGGVNYTEIHNIGGGNFGPATVWGNAARIYCQGNFATAPPYGPFAYSAEVSADTSWASMSTPAGLNMGAHSAVALTDGVRNASVCACSRAGVWRLVQ